MHPGARSLALDFTGSGDRVRLRLLLPPGVKTVAEVALDGKAQQYTITNIFGSRYIVLDAQRGSGMVEVRW